MKRTQLVLRPLPDPYQHRAHSSRGHYSYFLGAISYSFGTFSSFSEFSPSEGPSSEGHRPDLDLLPPSPSCRNQDSQKSKLHSVSVSLFCSLSNPGHCFSCASELHGSRLGRPLNYQIDCAFICIIPGLFAALGTVRL